MSLGKTYITISKDQEALRWILTLNEASNKLVCWCLRLSESKLDIGRHAEIRHQAADVGLKDNRKNLYSTVNF